LLTPRQFGSVKNVSHLATWWPLTGVGVLLVAGVFDALAGLAGGRPATAMVGLTMREE